MLTPAEIQLFIQEDSTSEVKRYARVGERYYDGIHDIRDYRMFYYNSDGVMVEDKYRTNTKIPHPFFKELTDQATQYILSGSSQFVLCDDPALQEELDIYFNNNDEFLDELMDCVCDMQTKGLAYMYAMKGADDRLHFLCADSLGVVEVEARFADDKQDHVIYWYVDRIDKDGRTVKKVMDWTKEETFFYIQLDDGAIVKDPDVAMNPRPHVLYREDGDESTYYEPLNFIPFFRLDNNKKQLSSLKPIKDLIDDYDIMASSLSNNLIDFDTPIHVVKGFMGDNLDELQQNLKTKKVIGVGDTGGIETYTVDIPYSARETKLSLDEKNIYRFGMGLNLSGLKDTSATTNIAIKSAYSLLDLRCLQIERGLKRFLRRLVNVVVDEINDKKRTDYQSSKIWFEFNHSIMCNESESVNDDKTRAETKQIEINTLLSMANILDDDTIIQNICDVLDVDYMAIKSKLPQNEEEKLDTDIVIADGVVVSE